VADWIGRPGSVQDAGRVRASECPRGLPRIGKLVEAREAAADQSAKDAARAPYLGTTAEILARLSPGA
jgi:hypothetical protein